MGNATELKSLFAYRLPACGGRGPINLNYSQSAKQTALLEGLIDLSILHSNSDEQCEGEHISLTKMPGIQGGECFGNSGEGCGRVTAGLNGGGSKAGTRFLLKYGPVKSVWFRVKRVSEPVKIQCTHLFLFNDMLLLVKCKNKAKKASLEQIAEVLGDTPVSKLPSDVRKKYQYVLMAKPILLKGVVLRNRSTKDKTHNIKFEICLGDFIYTVKGFNIVDRIEWFSAIQGSLEWQESIDRYLWTVRAPVQKDKRRAQFVTEFPETKVGSSGRNGSEGITQMYGVTGGGSVYRKGKKAEEREEKHSQKIRDYSEASHGSGFCDKVGVYQDTGHEKGESDWNKGERGLHLKYPTVSVAEEPQRSLFMKKGPSHISEDKLKYICSLVGKGIPGKQKTGQFEAHDKNRKVKPETSSRSIEWREGSSLSSATSANSSSLSDQASPSQVKAVCRCQCSCVKYGHVHDCNEARTTSSTFSDGESEHLSSASDPTEPEVSGSHCSLQSRRGVHLSSLSLSQYSLEGRFQCTESPRMKLVISPSSRSSVSSFADNSDHSSVESHGIGSADLGAERSFKGRSPVCTCPCCLSSGCPDFSEKVRGDCYARYLLEQEVSVAAQVEVNESLSKCSLTISDDVSRTAILDQQRINELENGPTTKGVRSGGTEKQSDSGKSADSYQEGSILLSLTDQGSGSLIVNMPKAMDQNDCGKEEVEVMAGTIPKLVERLTDESSWNKEFIYTFLMSFRLFMTPLQFFEMLCSRFHVSLPASPSEEDRVHYAKWKRAIQVKVLGIFERWLVYAYDDFEVVGNEQLRGKLKNFLTYARDCGFPEQSRELLNTFEEKHCEYLIEVKALAKDCQLGLGYSKVFRQSGIGGVDPVILAEQLTLLNWGYFKAIPPKAFIDNLTSRKKWLSRSRSATASSSSERAESLNTSALAAAGCASPPKNLEPVDGQVNLKRPVKSGDPICCGSRGVRHNDVAAYLKRTSSSSSLPSTINQGAHIGRMQKRPNCSTSSFHKKRLSSSSSLPTEMYAGDAEHKHCTSYYHSSIGGRTAEDQPNIYNCVDVLDGNGYIVNPGGAKLDRFIDRFNVESYWVATEVINEEGSKAQAKLIEKFIEVAQICYRLNNFYSVFAIVGALSLPQVKHLRRSWDGVADKSINIFSKLREFTSPLQNMKNYRTHVASIEGQPIIPFLPVYMKDLLFINDGNALILGDQELYTSFSRDPRLVRQRTAEKSQLPINSCEPEASNHDHARTTISPSSRSISKRLMSTCTGAASAGTGRTRMSYSTSCAQYSSTAARCKLTSSFDSTDVAIEPGAARPSGAAITTSACACDDVLDQELVHGSCGTIVIGMEEIVNFDKLRMMTRVVKTLASYSKFQYNLELRRDVLSYLKGALVYNFD